MGLMGGGMGGMGNSGTAVRSERMPMMVIAAGVGRPSRKAPLPYDVPTNHGRNNQHRFTQDVAGKRRNGDNCPL